MPIKSFQTGVSQWVVDCFGVDVAMDAEERNHRFLEEAIELVQARGCTASEAHQLVDYVFNRPVGEPAQEVGGVMVTLAALCNAAGIDIVGAADDELRRIWTKVPEIRAKQAARPKHSPLPATATEYRGAQVDPTYLLVRDPAFWSLDQSNAWHAAIPDVRKAFHDLARASVPKLGGFDVASGSDRTVYSHVESDGTVHVDEVVEAGGWHPMESAPRDGSVILLRWDAEEESLGWYIDNDAIGSHDPQFRWCFVDSGIEHSRAQEEPKGYFLNRAIEGKLGPTHWRPFAPDMGRTLMLARAIDLRESMHGINAVRAKQLLAAFLYVVDREGLRG